MYASLKTKKLVKEFKLSDGCIIWAYQGSKGNNPHLDIKICYKDRLTKGTQRTPAHIHWVIDLLIKKEHNKKLTLKFIKYLLEMWNKVEAFKNKNEQIKCKLKENSRKYYKNFKKLNQFGEYTVEFISHLIELMIIQEKTGLDNAFMFKNLLNAMLNEKDIFTIVGRARYNGR